MNRLHNTLLLFLISCSVFACAPRTGVSSDPTIVQYGSISALLSGVYDGQYSLEQVLGSGSLGLGTFQHLDGEAVVLDGEVWQVRSDGRVLKPEISTLTPYASVVQFKPEKSFSLRGLDSLASLEAAVDAQAPNKHRFVAFRVEGHFKQIKTRSVPAQTKPYPPLTEVVKEQKIFEAFEINGTLVGFRAPESVKSLRVAGYHIHFIADDRSLGGHVLALDLAEGQAELLTTAVLELYLTDDERLLDGIETGRAPSEHEIKAVEQIRQ